MTTALYPGSFDPLHLGHLDVIVQAARAFDDVVVGVLGNPAKGGGWLSIERRCALVVSSTEYLPTVRCVSWSGLTVELARQEGAGVIVRSAHKELRSERSMAVANALSGQVETFFVTPSAPVRHISSTLIRELLDAGAVTEALAMMPEPARAELSPPGG